MDKLRLLDPVNKKNKKSKTGLIKNGYYIRTSFNLFKDQINLPISSLKHNDKINTLICLKCGDDSKSIYHYNNYKLDGIKCKCGFIFIIAFNGTTKSLQSFEIIEILIKQLNVVLLKSNQ
jgi:hypothetical protein